MGELWNATAWPITSNWPKFPTHFPATHARKYIPLHSFSWVVDIPDLWPGGYTFTECCGLHNTTVIEQSKRLSFGQTGAFNSRGQLKCDGTRAENKFRLSAKRTSPFKSEGASVQSTTGSRGVRISGSNAGYTMFRGSVKGTGYPLHSPDSPSLPLPCVNVCHHIATGL